MGLGSNQSKITLNFNQEEVRSIGISIRVEIWGKQIPFSQTIPIIIFGICPIIIVTRFIKRPSSFVMNCCGKWIIRTTSYFFPYSLFLGWIFLSHLFFFFPFLYPLYFLSFIPFPFLFGKLLSLSSLTLPSPSLLHLFSLSFLHQKPHTHT